MKLDRRNTQLARDVDGLSCRVNEETHANAESLQSRDRVVQATVVLAEREPTFSRDLLPLFGHERRLKGFNACGDSDDFVMGTELEIQARTNTARERGDVVVLDM